MVKKDRTRIRNLHKNIDTLDPQKEEQLQLVNAVENCNQLSELQATTDRMQEDKEDVKMELLENVEIDDPIVHGESDGQEAIDKMTMQLDRTNLGGNDDQVQMNPDQHRSHNDKQQKSKRQRRRVKTMIQWLKETTYSNEVEDYALELGAQLSVIAVDLLVFMSEGQDLKPKLREFKSLVESFSFSYNCVVSRKIINLLEIAETELEAARESTNESEAMEEDKDRREISIKERLLDDLLKQFLDKIVCLEKICGTQYLTEPLLSADKVSWLMKNELRLVQKDLSEIMTKMNEFKRMFSWTVKNEDRKVKEFRKKMDEMGIRQVWNQLEESEAEIKRQKF